MFDFSAHMLSDGAHGWYDAAPITFDRYRKAIFDSQAEVQDIGFEANIIENHDEPRGVSRFLPDYAQNPMGAKMLGTVSLLLRGIPFIYQGQEIGIQNVVFNSINDYNDINTIDQYHLAKEAVAVTLESPAEQVLLSNKTGDSAKVSSIKDNQLTLGSCEVIVLKMA